VQQLQRHRVQQLQLLQLQQLQQLQQQQLQERQQLHPQVHEEACAGPVLRFTADVWWTEAMLKMSSFELKAFFASEPAICVAPDKMAQLKDARKKWQNREYARRSRSRKRERRVGGQSTKGRYSRLIRDLKTSNAALQSMSHLNQANTHDTHP
jgi:hypothetical protein